MHTDQEINHQVLVILLKRIIELLDRKEEPEDNIKADEIRAALRNELAGVIKAVKSIPEVDNKDLLKELKSLREAINAIEFNPNINVAGAEVTIPEIKVPNVVVPDFNIPTPQVNYTPPDIHIDAPIVNVPAPIVNVPEVNLDAIISELHTSLEKLRTNNKSRPLAVRLTDGAEWIKELKKQTAQTTQYMSDVSYSKNAAGLTINPATEETLSQILGKYAIQLDDVSTTNVTYVGKAAIGSAVGSAVWQVMKIDESGTPITLVITYADGNQNFDNIFSNRTSLTYS